MIRRRLLILLLAACVTAARTAEAGDDAPPAQLTVLAEEDLAAPLSSIARQYTLRRAVSLNLSFDSTAQQVARIEEGEPADVFITASEPALKQLKLQGMLDAYTYLPVARNRLMLAAAAGSPLRFALQEQGRLLDHLPAAAGARPAFAVIDGDLHAEGLFATDALKKLGLRTEEESAALPLSTPPPPADVTVFPETGEAADRVARGEAYGIMYATETGRFPGIREAALLPESLHRPIRYIAVVVAGTEMDAARKFVEFLRTPEAQDIFKSGGFLPAEEER